MDARNAELVATAITELSKAFLNNYFRALSEARATHGSELSQDLVANALAEAAKQNVELIEYFATSSSGFEGQEWSEALNGLRLGALEQANRLSDGSVSSAERITRFVADGADGLEVGIEGVSGGGRVVDALNRVNKIVDAAKLVSAVKDGDWGNVAGILVGNFMGVVAGSLTVAAGVAIGVSALPLIVITAVVAIVVEDFYSDKTNTFLDDLLGKSEDEATLAFMRRMVGDSGVQYLPTLRHRLFFGGESNNVFVGNAGEHSAMLGAGGNDVLIGAELGDYLTGSTGSDSLAGEGGDDSLRGGEDDDVLEGGRGNDYLEGGEGKDTYRFKAGHFVGDASTDIIVDSDGLGEITFDGLPIQGTGLGSDGISR